MGSLRWVELAGPCPFLTCEAEGPHRHPICPSCGAVRFGNLFCAECNAFHGRCFTCKRLLAECAGHPS